MTDSRARNQTLALAECIMGGSAGHRAIRQDHEAPTEACTLGSSLSRAAATVHGS